MLGTGLSYGELMGQLRRTDSLCQRDNFIRYITRKPNHKLKRKK